MEESDQTSESYAGVSLSIISLDDDQDFGEYIQGILSADGHRVRVVQTQADLYTEIGKDIPDIVLLDMNMGVTSGAEVLREIKSRWSKLCVVVVTGYPSLDSMRDTFKQDVFDYIAKPFSLEVLRKVIEQATEAFSLGQRPMDRLRSVLGRQIRLARTERGWTLRELSKVSSVSVSQLSSIERGTHLPSIESLIAISKALESTPSAWFEVAGF